MAQMTDASIAIDDPGQGRCFHCAQKFASEAMIAMRIPADGIASDARRGSIVRVSMCRSCAMRVSGDDAYLSMFLKQGIANVPELERDRPRDGEIGVFTHEEQLLVSAAYDGLPRFISNPQYERILAVIVKNARAHVLAELGRVMPGWPDAMLVKTLPNASLAWIDSFLKIDHTQTWPQAGSRLMVRMFTGENMQSGWIIVAPDSYAYTVFENGGVTVRSIIKEYLLTEISWGSGESGAVLSI